MNENPGGTPSPLKPVTDTKVPVSAQPAPVQATSVATAPVATTPATAVSVATQPTASQPQPTTEELKASGSAVEPKKKSKKGLVAAIIALLLLAVGGAVAAILILKPFGNKDAVPAAVAKLFSDDRPKNVVMDGKITMFNNAVDDAQTIVATDPSTTLSTLEVGFKSGINTVSNDQYVNATITATFADDNTFQFDANEVRVAGGDLYLQVSGIAEALEEYSNNVSGSEQTNCIGDDSGMTNCGSITTTGSTIMEYLGVFEAIDNYWIRIPGTDFSNLTDLVTLNGPTGCLVEAIGNMGEYKENFSSLYQENPFITYSTDNLKITQKNDQLYLLSFDANKMANFINAMSTAGLINDMLACMDEVATNENVTADDLSEIISSLPTIYVEINGQNDFTRVYLMGESEDGEASARADISFSYPATIKVEEPENYVELNAVLSELFSDFYGDDGFYSDYDSYYNYDSYDSDYNWDYDSWSDAIEINIPEM